MDNTDFDTNKVYNHWILKSEQDFKTMIHLYDSRVYHWSLFLGHLVIERLLKALVVKKTSTHAPFTHDLRRLAKIGALELSDEKRRHLDTITTFNINARYDDYKEDFYRKCTAEYTSIWINHIKTLREWIKTKL